MTVRRSHLPERKCEVKKKYAVLVPHNLPRRIRCRWSCFRSQTLSTHFRPRASDKSSPRRHVSRPLVSKTALPVALGDTLQLILLLDGVRVAAALGGVDELISKALGNSLDVAEGGLASADGEQGDGLVDTAEGRDIDGLTTDGAGRADAGRVFTRTTVDDGVDGNLYGVLVGNKVNLWRLSVSQRQGMTARVQAMISTYDLESVRNDLHGHELFAVVAAVHHERVCETLNNRAVGLAEPLSRPLSRGMRCVDRDEGHVVAARRK